MKPLALIGDTEPGEWLGGNARGERHDVGENLAVAFADQAALGVNDAKGIIRGVRLLVIGRNIRGVVNQRPVREMQEMADRPHLRVDVVTREIGVIAEIFIKARGDLHRDDQTHDHGQPETDGTS